MALVSPGIQVTITDESQYLPASIGSIPFVIFATSQDKRVNGFVAQGTIKTNAGKLYGVSSQRELINLFGTPQFARSAANTPLHGNELNEYGLMTAYSALGLGNRAFVMRADIDLKKLQGTASRPRGQVATGTNWLDLTESNWGIHEFNYSGSGAVNFVDRSSDTLTISNDAFVNSVNPFVPLDTVGVEGQYAVVTKTVDNLVYYKTWRNTWVGLGTDQWASNVPMLTGSKTGSQVNIATTGQIAVNSNCTVNGRLVSVFTAHTTVAAFAANINTVMVDTYQGPMYARANAQDRLEFYGRKNSLNLTGNVVLKDGKNTPLFKLGMLGQAPDLPSDTTYAHSGNVTVMNNQYTVSWNWDTGDQVWMGSTVIANPAAIQYSQYYDIPNWSTNQNPRPNRSVWVKTSAQGNGVNLALKQYSRTTQDWRSVANKVYEDGYTAVYDLDKGGGGININVGSVIAMYDSLNTGQTGFKLYQLRKAGVTKVTGNSIGTWTLTSGNQFTVTASTVSGITVTFTCTVPAAVGSQTAAERFALAVLNQNIPNVGAEVESTGAVTLIHRSGGIISLTNVGAGTAVSDAGFTASTLGVDQYIGKSNGSVHLSNWQPVDYEISTVKPVLDPEDGELWYYDELDADIMIADSTGWKGYRTVALDVRGFNLTLTDPNGVIFASVAPDSQSTGAVLESGDLWIDTSNLAEYPVLHRYDSVSQIWTRLDKTDRLTQNGIIFADARWATNGTTDPVKDAFPNISSLLLSNYIDLDCPDFRLYPRGTLLFNTRRSGYVVKKFVKNYFNVVAYPTNVLPTKRSTWVSSIGLDLTGNPMLGVRAQRNEIVTAMRGAVASNQDLREEVYNFNLLTAPGYPELIPTLTNLNVDRGETGFVIGDVSMTLPATAADLVNYDINNILTASPYLALYYPSGMAIDLDGNQICVPPSHMALRTFLYNDQVAYQWFAPAGNRRGLVDNASDLGFIDANTGRFIRNGLNNQLRDTLYERRINPITKINGVGLTVYGQKTRNPAQSGGGSSLDRVNVARLVNYLRVILQGVANQFLFEPNDKTTRDQIKGLIESLFTDLIAKRGIYDYIVVCDETNNTGDRVARNELYCDVAIEPVRAVEFIYIPVRLRNPGTVGQTAIGTPT